MERERERLQRQGPIVVQEVPANLEQLGGGGDPANLVQELARGLSAHTKVVQYFFIFCTRAESRAAGEPTAS